MDEIMKILPLAGLRAFEVPRPVLMPKAVADQDGHHAAEPDTSGVDTIVVPAQKEGFDQVFIGENCWYAIRIAGGKLSKIKYIAGYQTNPISAITHYASIDHIEPYGESGKYKLVFSGPAQEIDPIPYGDAPSGFMQGPRYTTLAKLKAAKTLPDIS